MAFSSLACLFCGAGYAETVPVVNDVFKTAAEQSLIFFTASDFAEAFEDADGDILVKIRIAGLSDQGILKLSGNAVEADDEIESADLSGLSFEPDQGWTGRTFFNWNGSDGASYASSEAAVHIRDHASNSLPVVKNIEKTGNEDITLWFAGSDFADAFEDVDGDILDKIRITTLPGDGVLKLDDTEIVPGDVIESADMGSLTFTPDKDWNGAASFKWEASDGTDWSSSPADVNISITAEPSASVVIRKKEKEDANVEFDISDLADAELDAGSIFMLMTLPSNGLMLFDYRKTTETHSFNGGPLVSGQKMPMAELLEGELVFRPDENFHGYAEFLWKVSYAGQWLDDNSTRIAISPVNDTPVTKNIRKSGNKETTVYFTARDFANAFEDADSDILSSIRITSLPSDGILEMNSELVNTGQVIEAEELDRLSYIPGDPWDGSDKFEWTGSDGTAYAVASAWVSITDNGTNEPPEPGNIIKTGEENRTFCFTASDFADVVEDADGDTLNRIRITDAPANGALKLNDTPVSDNAEISASDLGNLCFAPDEGWYGQTLFKWEASDGHAWSVFPADAEVTIVSAPVRIGTIFKSGTEDADVEFDQSDLYNFELDETSLIKVVTFPEHGTLLFDPEKTTGEHVFDGDPMAQGQEMPIPELLAGELVFRPDENFYGAAEFIWRASKAGVWSEDDRIMLIITPANDRPVLKEISKTGYENTPIPFSASDFLSAFDDVDGDMLSGIQIIALPDNGLLLYDDTPAAQDDVIPVSELNRLSFVPDENQTGSARFVWSGSDGTAYTAAPAAVNIRIRPGYHSADYNSPDYEISLSELLRVIQLYNHSSIQCDAGSEDGYGAGEGSRTCFPHDSDYAPQDWRISLSELLRIIQLYKASGYHADLNGEDDFVPGK